MSSLIEKLFAIDDALTSASLAHAFGGAIALAYCTQEPRGTRDLDVNIFSDSSRAKAVLAELPDEIAVSAKDVSTVKRDGQTRLWWDDTPVDVFLNNHPLHERVATGVVWVPLAGRDVPVLDCASLVLFKALFNRTKDWADVEAVADASPDDVQEAADQLQELLAPDDPVAKRLAKLVAQAAP